MRDKNLVFLYVGIAALAGAVAFADALLRWQCSSAPVLAGYFALTLAASAVKLRLPGLAGTVSLGFVSVLDGIALMNLSEVVVVATAAALMQQLWNASEKPQPIQIAFNLGVMTASTWVAYNAAHLLAPESALLRILVAVAPLYLLNAAAVAGVLSIVSTGGLDKIWKKFQLTIFPFYLVGAVLAVLIGEARMVYAGTPIVLPLMILTYLSFSSYRSLVERHA